MLYLRFTLATRGLARISPAWCGTLLRLPEHQNKVFWQHLSTFHLSSYQNSSSSSTPVSSTVSKKFIADLTKEDEIDEYKPREVTWTEHMTVPNIITMSRMVLSPWLGYAIYYDMKTVAITGCIVFGISDWLDGFIAKNYNQATVLGAFIDPVADKVLIGTVAGALALKGLIPMSLAGIILGRDLIILVASFYIRGAEKPKDAPFFDTTYSSTYSINPSLLSKINTACQLGMLSATLGCDIFVPEMLHLVEPLWYITVVTTVGSGLGYLGGDGITRSRGDGKGKGFFK